jgi:hypothetical protein
MGTVMVADADLQFSQRESCIAELTAMTYESVTELSPSDCPTSEPERAEKKQASIDEIVESLKAVGDDAEQIGRLLFEEKRLVAQFFELLQKLMQPQTPSIGVSASIFPFKTGGGVAQAQLDPAGKLRLTFEDGGQELLDLTEAKNRELMVAVGGDIMSTLNDLASQTPEEGLPKPPLVQDVPTKIPAPLSLPPPAELEQLPVINFEAPIALPELESAELPAEAQEAPDVPEVPAAPVIFEEENVNGKILELEAETLGYLEMLGNEVFERSPVSTYFDDWMVNLRQIILSFESSEFVGPDEAFTKEYNQIFGDIEDELSKRLLSEAEIEVSARSLVKSLYLLNKIDEGYAAQTKEIVVKGKSAIEHLTRNMQQLEAELAEVAQIKTSYRHPLQKMAKEQKQSELTQKLNAAKKRLALAVGTSSVDHGKVGDIDAEYPTQTQELADKRNSALDILSKEVHVLEEELVQIDKTKTSNPLKDVAKKQKLFDTNEKLIAAKKRLELAEQTSNAEQERIRAEYEKKKQATLGQVQSLEKDIATKATDDSAEVRKQATKALANAVKSLVQRKTASPQ